MRIVEAMIACIILVMGLSASTYISSVYTVTENENMQKSALNILNVLNNVDVIKRIINNENIWKPEMKSLLENLLPPETFFNLTIRSSLTGDILAELSNLGGWETSSNFSSINIEQREAMTISLPLGKTEYLPLDVILVMDISGSMNNKLPGDTRTKIDATKDAATTFLEQLSSSRDRVGLVTFSTEAFLMTQLTTNFVEVKSDIDNLNPGGWTNIGDGISYATEEYNLHGRMSNNTNWIIILLSDGIANRPLEINATEYAIEKSEEAYNLGSNQSLRIYTIGLGAKGDINEILLEQIAEGPLEGVEKEPEGKYYYAPSSEDLADIYTNIARDLMFKVEYDVILIELTLVKPR
ncbi:MAG: vWA domain-containing protein [Candidatus Kariarchaeaceae archaeon]